MIRAHEYTPNEYPFRGRRSFIVIGEKKPMDALDASQIPKLHSTIKRFGQEYSAVAKDAEMLDASSARVVVKYEPAMPPLH